MQGSEQQIPTLVFVFCVMSAMAFVVAGSRWMWRIYKTGRIPKQTYNDAIIESQQDSFFCVIMISLFVGIYDFLLAGQPLRVSGEITVLVLTCGYLFYAVRKSGANMRTTFKLGLKRVAGVGALCLLGWAVTFLFGYIVAKILSLLSAMNTEDFLVAVVFIAAGLWTIPIFVLGYKIRQRDDVRPALKGKSPHVFLWPVLLAYLVLLVPLVILDTVRSEEWQAQQHAKPVRTI